MLEKRNVGMPLKSAAGDAREFDDIVDFAAKKMDRLRSTGPSPKSRKGSCRAEDSCVNVPEELV